MSEIKLKPCPFCGGEAYYRTPTHLEGTAFDVMMVECKHCGASPYAVEVYENDTEENKRKAIAEFWNRRADNKPIRQSCKTCKYYTPDPNYRDGDMGNCRYLEKIWEKPFYVNEARAECEHFQAAERRNENGNET